MKRTLSAKWRRYLPPLILLTIGILALTRCSDGRVPITSRYAGCYEERSEFGVERLTISADGYVTSAAGRLKFDLIRDKMGHGITFQGRGLIMDRSHRLIPNDGALILRYSADGSSLSVPIRLPQNTTTFHKGCN